MFAFVIPTKTFLTFTLPYFNLVIVQEARRHAMPPFNQINRDLNTKGVDSTKALGEYEYSSQLKN